MGDGWLAQGRSTEAQLWSTMSQTGERQPKDTQDRYTPATCVLAHSTVSPMVATIGPAPLRGPNGTFAPLSIQILAEIPPFGCAQPLFSENSHFVCQEWGLGGISSGTEPPTISHKGLKVIFSMIYFGCVQVA